MVSKSQSKLIRSLNQKKYRFKHGLFIVEGRKGIEEFLKSSFQLHQLFTIEHFDGINTNLVTEVSEQELKQITHLTTPQVALAIFKIPKTTNAVISGLTLALDGVRDPGNLGTIIRLCDWFGIKTLLCSNDTVDCYNTKVVQATMGSLTRVDIQYVDLAEVLKTYKKPIYGTFMNGDSIYSSQFLTEGVIVMGNEANGISEAVENICTQRISIPQFGNSQDTESLNVATAAAITLGEFARQTIEM